MRTELVRDGERFVRIPLGGRPMNLAFDATGKRLYVTNYLSNAVQVVDVAGRRVERTLALGGALQPSLARQGEAIFHDALRSADGWYSCHSCHYEAGTNAVTMDTKNDGSFGTYKMVLSLRNARNTGPWFWHGWQQDFTGAIAKSLADTMQGPTPSDDDARAIVAYLEQLEQPPQQQRGPDGSLSAAAERGRQVFSSAAAGCAQCHQGAYLTDGQIHDVGLGSEYDKYQGYNTPSLVDIGNRAGYLHHGRAKDLDELLLDLHSPAKVSGTRELTAEERADLVAYLKSL
jgi:YVTN family beta-propeller protein